MPAVTPSRPEWYSDEKAAIICQLLESGQSLKRICEQPDMPSAGTVHAWVAKRPKFAEIYARARDLALDRMAEEVIEIADDGSNDTYKDAQGNPRIDYDHIQRSKLRFDARRWYLSKLAPRKYGDRVEVEHSGEVAQVIQLVVAQSGGGQIAEGGPVLDITALVEES